MTNEIKTQQELLLAIRNGEMHPERSTAYWTPEERAELQRLRESLKLHYCCGDPRVQYSSSFWQWECWQDRESPDREIPVRSSVSAPSVWSGNVPTMTERRNAVV